MAGVSSSLLLQLRSCPYPKHLKGLQLNGLITVTSLAPASDTRIPIEDQNIDERIFCETLFNHFRKHKVEISNAINKTFPFLEGLRDRGFITEKLFQDSEESCRNLVPVKKVVYGVLNELEKTFNLSLLEAMFSEVNMKEYPDLIHLYRSFERVIKERFCFQEREEEERPSIQPRLEEGTGENSHRSLSWSHAASASHIGTAPPANGLSEDLCDTEQINAKTKDLTSDKNDSPGSQQANKTCTQESEAAGSSEQAAFQVNNGDARPEMPSPLPCDEDSRAELPTRGIQIDSCTVPLVDIKKEKPFDYSGAETMVRHSDSSESSGEEERLEALPSGFESGPDEEGISSDDSLELSNEEEPQEALSLVPRSGSGPGIEKYSCVPCPSKGGPRGQEAKAGRNQAFDMTVKATHRLAMSPTFAQKKAAAEENCSKQTVANLPGKKTVNLGPLKRRRKRGPRIPRDKSMDFLSPELTVTCGQMKGILYKEKLKQGTSEKCIQTEDGKWFTGREFEIEGGRERWKNWKLSVRCGGWPLQRLMKNGSLPVPPRTRQRRRLDSPKDVIDPYPENSNECAVCRDGGDLFCCDACSRSFHEHCHIPPVEAERDPWSCIFCEIKAVQARCLESQPSHQESEILKRQMLPEEKLKCEFLLVKVYCCSKRLFLDRELYYSRQSCQGQREPTWLDKIKKRLKEEHYHRVEEFVQDVRLTFHNDRTYYRDHESVRLGLQLEADFEKNFKLLFAIQ
ncbi:nuclear body protein SP140-like protein [Orycteropus afer afer]|uniref:Nuclear body protein SP140-like protein n=1 Tax=Orycteropus afer afer TaxID=1230840 RepID=A0A8B7A3V5_ORYAF|nr:nuclear body protein SP140-like protein [Orycteropus afer afer]